jgi:RNA polymerase sigma-70 factor (ECF subfamily)
MDPLTRLALAARAGDADSLERFAATGYDDVWRLCAALVDPSSADDLAQEVFGRAVRALPEYRGESAARTWLLSIARRTCMDELRSRSRQRRTLRAVASTAHTASVPDHSGQLAVEDLLARLDPDRRVAVLLTQVLGLSYEEVAEICACPVGTVRSRVARGRSDLLALLDADADAGAAAPGGGGAQAGPRA